jgi:hypothetical protein
MKNSTKPAEKRRPVPMKIKLQVALDQLAVFYRAAGEIPPDSGPVKWELDHVPPLALRAIAPNGQHVPHQHSPNSLKWLPKAKHREKTTGRRGESKLSIRDGDQGKIAKVDRIVKKRKAREAPPEVKAKAKPKAKIPSPVKKKAEPQRRASGYVRNGV